MERQLAAERGESVGSKAEVLALEPDLAILKHTVELKHDYFVPIGIRQTETLPIPVDAGGTNNRQGRAGFILSNDPSMLQSCGKSTSHQSASENFGD
jgi:hypothetical protein